MAAKAGGTRKAREAGKTSPAAKGSQDNKTDLGGTAGQVNEAGQGGVAGQVSQADQGGAASQISQSGQGSEAGQPVQVRNVVEISLAGPDGALHARAIADAVTGSGVKESQPAKGRQDDSDSPSAIEGIFVRSFLPTFRRAGFAFTSDGMGIALSAISAEQLKALLAEPMLSVEFCDFLPDGAIVGAAEATEQNDAE